MACLHRGPGEPVGIGDLVQTLFSRRKQVQVVLVEPAQQLSPLGIESSPWLSLAVP
ncbi:MAG: hypothetical protein ACRDZ3_21465 [Acidimicrobiia bacterium]